ncbi:MAG: serine hydrolase [Acidobacteriota bacterium]
MRCCLVGSAPCASSVPLGGAVALAARRQRGRIPWALACLAAAGFMCGTASAQSTARARATTYSGASSSARQAALPQVPRYKVDDRGDLVPDIRADAAIIYSPATGRILWEEKAFDQHAIASITKVMTALCFLEGRPDLDRTVTILRSDTRGASTTYLRSGQRVSFSDLMHLLLVGSDNAAARVLARNSPLGAAGFVSRMNEKAAELGLTSTAYADPSGLLARNVSSAYDMARLIAHAAGDDYLSGIMRQAEFTYQVNGRSRTIRNTNQLVGSPDIEVLGGKTGFISKAGYCLATLLRLPEVNETVAVVVLGARSNAARFWETRHLFNWLMARLPVFATGRPPLGPTSPPHLQ